MEMTNGFLDHLTFMIECDITILGINAKIPFDSERLKVRINEANISNKLKEKLLKDNMLEQLVYEVMFKTVKRKFLQEIQLRFQTYCLYVFLLL